MKEFKSVDELKKYILSTLFYNEGIIYFFKEDLTINYIKDKFKDYNNVVLKFEDEDDNECFTSSKNIYNRREVYVELTGENQYTIYFRTSPLPNKDNEETW